MAEQYQKIKYNGHCSKDSNCITHCTTFGLSDSKCAEHYSNCSHAHVLECPECINIILTLDEISRNIEQITDKDTQREVKFDYKNASKHIVEWSRHNLRAARQNAEKKFRHLTDGPRRGFLYIRLESKNLASRLPSSSKYIHTLEKEVCLCWSDHPFGKIHYHYLRPLLQILLRFLLLHFLPSHISSLSLMLHRRNLIHSAQVKSSQNSLKPIILIYQNCTSAQTMQGISRRIQRLKWRK